jgi:CRISPR-associated endoribonuclease Cas6
MILRICLRGRGSIVLPKHYNHLTQAFFYRNMDPALANFIHNIGFVYGKRRFKLLTFSKIMGRILEKNYKKEVILFDENITLFFASPLMDIVSYLSNTRGGGRLFCYFRLHAG